MTSIVRVSSGNKEADLILGGGFPINSINVLMGEPGTGKTLFAEQLLFHNADGDRPVLYLTTLSEPLSKVVTYLQQFAFTTRGRWEPPSSTTISEASWSRKDRMRYRPD